MPGLGRRDAGAWRGGKKEKWEQTWPGPTCNVKILWARSFFRNKGLQVNIIEQYGHMAL